MSRFLLRRILSAAGDYVLKPAASKGSTSLSSTAR